MNEAAAGEVLLVRAFETAADMPWTAQDRAWASRVAQEEVGAAAPMERFVAARAHAALQKLEGVEPTLARWRALKLWRGECLWLALATGLVLGMLADHIGSTQRINLLAPPVWAVIGWNLAVYVWLLWHGLSAARRRAAAPQRPAGWLRRGMTRLLGRWVVARRARKGATSAAAWQAFTSDWARHGAPLAEARAALCLHGAAAALALGLVAGLYLRGLVLDYRVGWESTFLDASTVHAVLSALLAPATALSGIALPDVPGMQALRLQPGATPPAAASAAPWIHLYALQLLLLVLLPRCALALWAGWRAHSLARRFPLPLDDLYFQRLRWQQRGGALQVCVWPYAQTPDAAAALGLRAIVAHVFGDGASLQLAPTTAFGGEDELGAAPADGTLALALFDLGATPEAENQGRFMRWLGASQAAPATMLVDEASFAQRFGRQSQRLPARRQAWSDLAAGVGSVAVFVDLQSPDLDSAESALQTLRIPAAAKR
jgi:hypothetical protein